MVSSHLNPTQAQGFSPDGPGAEQGFLSLLLRKLSQNTQPFEVLLFLSEKKMMKQISFTKMLFSSSVMFLLKPYKWACKPGGRKCK